MKSIARGILGLLLLSGTQPVIAETLPDECMLADQYRVQLDFLAHDLAFQGEDPAKLPDTLVKLSNLGQAVQLHYDRCLQEANIDPGFACQVAANARRHIHGASMEAKVLKMGYQYAADQAHWDNILRNSSSLCPLAFGV